MTSLSFDSTACMSMMSILLLLPNTACRTVRFSVGNDIRCTRVRTYQIEFASCKCFCSVCVDFNVFRCNNLRFLRTNKSITTTTNKHVHRVSVCDIGVSIFHLLFVVGAASLLYSALFGECTCRTHKKIPKHTRSKRAAVVNSISCVRIVG